MKTDEVKNKVYKIKNDVIFKELFSKKGNEEFLIEFLSNLLKIEIKKIEIRKRSRTRNRQCHRKSRNNRYKSNNK